MPDVTQLLSQIESGDPAATAQLLPLVYDELRKLAAARLADEKPGQTLQATALVHEAYLKLVDVDRVEHWNSRGHFFGAAAEAMRRILVDQARRKLRPKHGGRLNRVALESAAACAPQRCQETLAISEALDKLALESAAKAELVKLRYFAGMTSQEAAKALGVSLATADRYWTYAKAFMLCELEEKKTEESGETR